MENRVSALAAWALVLLLAFGAAKWSLLSAAILPAALLLYCNWALYRLFHRRRGLFFSLGAIGLHWLHYLYTCATFAIVALETSLRFVSGSAQPLQPAGQPGSLVVRD